MKKIRESNIYVLFKKIGDEQYFKVGKASDVIQRVSTLNKAWGLFEEGSISINLKNEHFKLEKNFGIHMEKIVLRGLCVFGYDPLVSEEHCMKDGYHEFFKAKTGQNKLNVVMDVLSILEPYKATTEIKTKPLDQLNFANLKKEVNLSNITPQQISLTHIEYFFELLKKGQLEDWKKEICAISSEETEWKKAQGIDPRANIRSGKDHKEKKLYWELKNRLENSDSKEKSQNIRTLGYLKTFIKSICKLFGRTLDQINFEVFKHLLLKILSSKTVSSVYNVLTGTKSLSEKTASRRKLNVQEWITRELGVGAETASAAA